MGEESIKDCCNVTLQASPFPMKSGVYSDEQIELLNSEDNYYDKN